MANYFQLISKATGLPTSFNVIDTQLCTNYHQPVNPTRYLGGWYDAIGWRVASGKSLSQVWDEFQEYIDNPEEDTKMRNYYRTMQSIVSYLMEYYTTNSWCGR